MNHEDGFVVCAVEFAVDGERKDVGKLLVSNRGDEIHKVDH